MQEIRVAAAQFEHRDGDKEYNLSRIRLLTRRAADQGARIVSFHEGCIPGYSWIQPADSSNSSLGVPHPPSLSGESYSPVLSVIVRISPSLEICVSIFKSSGISSYSFI